MLSINGIDSAVEAADYYENLAARDDYYLEGGEPPGQWLGQGAEALGLSGQIAGGFSGGARRTRPRDRRGTRSWRR